MTAKNYSLLAAVIFTIVAILQLSRAVMNVQVMVGSHTMPAWPSWIAFCVAGGLAWLGFSAARD
jgi:hypothetical protein